jgi:hypothetical protein
MVRTERGVLKNSAKSNRASTFFKISLILGHFRITNDMNHKTILNLLSEHWSISLKIEIFEKIHTKYFEIVCKKSVLLSCLVILSSGLEIEHSYWDYTEFIITLKQPMSKKLGKITFFLLIWNSGGSTRIKDKNQVY